MSGTKVKTLYKNLKTQDESSLETFQELPITFRDASSTSPVPLDIYVSEDKASIKLPGSSGSESSATINNNGAPVPDSTTRILLSSDPNAPLAAIKAATATNSAYVSVDSDPALGGVQSTVASWGSSGKSAVSVAGSDISITASTSSVGQQTRILLEGADNKVSVSGSLHVNVEDHGSPIDVFSVNSETSAGTLTAMISATANAFGVGASSTSISSDLVSINGPATTITGDVTINAQNQVKIALENTGSEDEIFRLDVQGNSPRSLIAATTDGAGPDLSTLTLSPHQLRLYGDSLVLANTTADGSTAALVAGGSGSEAKLEGDQVTLDAGLGTVTVDSSSTTINCTAGVLTINADNPPASNSAEVRLGSGALHVETQDTGTGRVAELKVDSGGGSLPEVRITGAILHAEQGVSISNGNVTIEGSDSTGLLYLPDVPQESDWSGDTAIYAYYLGVDTADGRVYRNTTGFFTGTHVYPCNGLIPVGSAVELINGVATISSTAGSPVCSGVVVTSKEVTTETLHSLSSGTSINGVTHLVRVASVGDCRTSGLLGFNVCNEGGAIQPGDLLVTSNTPGYLMRQIDDVIRSSTVGKAMEAVVFDENGQATGVYGYLYCG
jgi:hypothetical protein